MSRTLAARLLLPRDRTTQLTRRTDTGRQVRNRDLHVAFVLSLPYPDATGGAERWVKEAARALRRHVRVTEHYLDSRNLVPAGGEVVTHRPLIPRTRGGQRVAIAPGVLAAMSADIVHVHQYGSLTAQVMGLAGRIRRRPVFMTDHGSSGLVHGARLHMLHLFTGYLCVSRFAAQFTPPSRTRVVYGGVDSDRFIPGERADSPFALYVGRLLPQKGLLTLIRALPQHAHLVIAGRPDEVSAPGYLATLRHEARGRSVSFVIDADEDELISLYQSAWVTVLPTVTSDGTGRRLRVPELLGLVMLESMSCGTPVIASRLPAIEEVVSSRSGAVITPGSVAELRAGLRRFLSDRGLVERRGRAARQEVTSRFTWELVAHRLLNGYAELLMA